MLTASELNKDIFRVVRQNKDNNSHLFQVANYEMLMQRGSIISNTIFAYIRTPLLAEFLRIASRFKNEKAGDLVSRITATAKDDIPKFWEFTLNEEQAFALFKHVQNHEVQLENILIDGSNQSDDRKFPRISALCLFIKRGNGNVLLPEEERFMKINDRFLMCGTHYSYQKFNTLINNPQALSKFLS